MRVRRKAFSPFSTAVLISAFGINPTPSKEQREAIAAAIGTTERRVQVWFQNRRQRISTSVKTVPRDEAVAASQPAPSAEEPPSPPADGIAQAMPLPPAAALPTIDAATLMTVMPYGERPLKEGRIKDGMKMEAFTTLYPPFEILWANDDWLDFCGFQGTQVAGQVSERRARACIDTTAAFNLGPLSSLSPLSLAASGGRRRRSFPFRRPHPTAPSLPLPSHQPPPASPPPSSFASFIHTL